MLSALNYNLSWRGLCNHGLAKAEMRKDNIQEFKVGFTKQGKLPTEDLGKGY